MTPYVLMLYADMDDQYITDSELAEINPSFTIKYLPGVEEVNEYIAKEGVPLLILLNDNGGIIEKAHALHRLKANPDYGHIPMVVLGEKTSDDYVKECYRAGASTFIIKPSSIEETKKKIQTFFKYWFEVAEV